MMIKNIKSLADIYRIDHNNDVILYNPYTLKKKFLINPSLEEIAVETNSLKVENLIIPDPVMTTIKIVMTVACNFRCDYCLVFNNIRKVPNKSINQADADQIISYYNSNIKNGMIQFTGGEPLLNWEKISYILDNTNAFYVLQTNGSLVTPEIARRLAEKNVLVLISLDGETEQENASRKFTSGKSTFGKVLEGYYLLREAGCRVGLSMVATEMNVERLYEITYNLKSKLNPDSFGFNIPHYTKYHNSDVDIEEYTEQMKKIFHFAKAEGIYIDQISRRLKPLIMEQFRLMDCTSGGEQIVFYPNGMTSNCVNYPAYTRTYDIDRWVKRLPIHRKLCSHCSAIGICGGGCLFDGIKRYSEGVDLRNCYYTKSMLDFMLTDMLTTLKECGDYESCLKKYYGLIGFSEKQIISAGHETNSDTLVLNQDNT